MARQDPRLEDAAPTVNATLQDRSIRHLLYVLRLSTSEANTVLDTLDNEITPDILDQLERRLSRIDQRGFDTGPATTQRLEDLFTAFDTIIGEGRQAMQGNLSGRLAEIARSEAEWQAGALTQAIPVQWETTIPSPEILRQAVLERPFDGMPLSGWFDGLERQAQQNLQRAVRQGLIEGETMAQITSRVRRTIDVTRNSAEAVARTSVIHASTQARERTMAENSEVVKGVQIVVTLDNRTCTTCMGYDGKVFEPEQGQRPPFHAQCRCATAPVTKSWKELGIDLQEAPEGTRASMDGQVPESMTYNDWLKRQGADIQEEALGAKRAKLYREGNLSVEQFTDRRGRKLTLQELRQREPDVFEAAGVSV